MTFLSGHVLALGWDKVEGNVTNNSSNFSTDDFLNDCELVVVVCYECACTSQCIILVLENELANMMDYQIDLASDNLTWTTTSLLSMACEYSSFWWEFFYLVFSCIFLYCLFWYYLILSYIIFSCIILYYLLLHDLLLSFIVLYCILFSGILFSGIVFSCISCIFVWTRLYHIR